MPEKKKFYVTTPIYYGNGLPHVGHFYSSTIADILHRYHKISGYESRFTTGIDENSQKAVIKAQEEWKDILEYLDKMAAGHKKVWDYFGMDYTDFIRTTEPRHHALVQKVLQHCFDAWDIYQWVYEWMYCVWCESFKKDDDLVYMNKTSGITFPITPKITPSENIIKVCPDHLTTPDSIKEKNYFFKLSRYQDWVSELYDANPDFVLPHFRYNEVKAFVGRWLEDFSISRETNTFGIPLPFDSSQVTYVWFDALFNYYTSCVSSRWWDKNNEDFIDESDFWPTNLHVVGKDIIRFHAIFWPAMLASYFDLWEQGSDGVLHYTSTDTEKLPKNILTGWHFTIDGQKISKSLWNSIDPVSYSKEYSKELLILYTLSAFPIWNDGDYDRAQAILTYNAKLANNLWNLVNRVVVLSLKLKENSGVLDSNSLLNSLPWKGKEAAEKSKQLFTEYNLKWVLDASFEYLDTLNKFADDKQPWQTIKDDQKTTTETLYTLAEWLRQVGLHLYPFFPEKMSEMFTKLGLTDYSTQLKAGWLESLLKKQEKFVILEKGEPLFKRINIEE
jgi:methionyl-tRNA synthetase